MVIIRISILALQSAVHEHIRHIGLSGYGGIAIKRVEQLDEVDGLMLPGGESTTLRRLMDLYGFKGELRQLDLPISGTCAGLIVLTKNVKNESDYLNKLDITIERNSLDRQVDSFESELDAKGIANNIKGVFTRAPRITKADNGVEILSKVGGKTVAVKRGQYLGVSFHPELTDDYHITRHFIEHMVKH